MTLHTKQDHYIALQEAMEKLYIALRSSDQEYAEREEREALYMIKGVLCDINLRDVEADRKMLPVFLRRQAD